jgi:hypothetical protein
MQPLNENPPLGFKSKNPALHPGHNVPNSTAAIGDSWSLASETRWSHEMGRFMSPDFNAADDDLDPVLDPKSETRGSGENGGNASGKASTQYLFSFQCHLRVIRLANCSR